MRKRKVIGSAITVVLALGLASPLLAGKKQESKVRAARWVYEELFGNEQQRIPAALLADTRCLAIFPDLVKAAFGFGGSHGVGVVGCRNEEGKWSPPSFLVITEGSFGLQVGFKASDVVLFFITDRSAQALLQKRLSFGGTLSVAAGPVGKTAGTTSDINLSDDVYLYVQDRGLFVGASVDGLRLGTGAKAMRKYYGHYVWPGEILFEHKAPTTPPEALEFQQGLDKLPWE